MSHGIAYVQRKAFVSCRFRETLHWPLVFMVYDTYFSAKILIFTSCEVQLDGYRGACLLDRGNSSKNGVPKGVFLRAIADNK